MLKLILQSLSVFILNIF